MRRVTLTWEKKKRQGLQIEDEVHIDVHIKTNYRIIACYLVHCQTFAPGKNMHCKKYLDYYKSGWQTIF